MSAVKTENLGQLSGDLCIGSARLPADIVELTADGAVLRAKADLAALAPRALRISGIGHLPILDIRSCGDDMFLLVFDRPPPKVRRKLARHIGAADLDILGPALAYLSAN